MTSCILFRLPQFIACPLIIRRDRCIVQRRVHENSFRFLEVLPGKERPRNLWMVHHAKSYPYDHRYQSKQVGVYCAGYEKTHIFRIKNCY